MYDAKATVPPDLLRQMTRAIAHRGPDGEGTYFSGPVGLGHLRLAIIDLNTGAQPMTNEDGTCWIVFNGEIYNYLELRQELLAKGHQFKSTTDTEVIIHLYEEYGVECLSRLRGMFAFAIWDDRKKTLFLARDRVGIKPLYYIDTGKAFLFASEIKALLVDSEVNRRVDPQMVDRFFTFLYLPGRETLFKDVYKLEPGHYLVIKNGHVTDGKYWDLNFERNPSWTSIDQAAEALRELFTRTVKDHMISDVPVGILLSGGVDSTIVLSAAVEQTNKKIKTFTVGFKSEDFDDERPYARMAAERFGAEHNEITLSPEEFSSFLPSYVRHMEEPVCEAPAIALYYVSKLARKSVTVLLSGEGGDEAFGGYNTYRNILMLERAKSMAGPLKGILPQCINAASRINGFGRLQKYASLIKPRLPDYYYSFTSSPFSFFNQNRDRLYSDEFLAGVSVKKSTEIIRRLFHAVEGRPCLDQMLYVDTKTWLPDDLLIKADKITMANSLELRVPLLDHLVLEFAAGLPPNFKVQGMETKRVLKKAFSRSIPEAILKRRKTGFPVPLRKWLQNDLRDYAHDILLSQRATQRGFFRKGQMEAALADAENGQLSKELFALLTLELWHREFVDSPAAVHQLSA
jgi:asparagine synthase (glutamine-hydrolysing)